MNTRIQVEHPVTEMLTGTDLVQEQLRVAAGEQLSFPEGGVKVDGHAIEFRINAEDPVRGFMPAPGTLSAWSPPRMKQVRFDSHAYRGYRIPAYYDSLLGKLIVHGADRNDAIVRARLGLETFRAEGLATTMPFHRQLLNHADFLNGSVHTRWVESEFEHGRSAHNQAD